MDDRLEQPSHPEWARRWAAFDSGVVRATEVALFLIGATFTVLISLEVASRFLFQFSIFMINALAQFLLVWFFTLGAGLALRRGAHVGLGLVVESLPDRARKAVALVANLLVFAFFGMMLVSGFFTLKPALRQFESSLGVTLIWVMLAFPVGFILLIYHQLALVVGVRLEGTSAQL